jgi:hypothetical protein
MLTMIHAIDGVVTKHRKEYADLFGRNVVDTFCTAFAAVSRHDVGSNTTQGSCVRGE